MRLLKTHPILGLVNSYLVDSPQPSNLSYAWNGGSLLGLCLITQLATGIFLAMHYIASADLAFISVESIMRDVNSGWMIRYIHANTASLFFAIIYLHIARGMWYGSYGTPRTLPWSIGVIILILLIVTAFLGYVLVYGQMSLWGATVITNLVSAVPWIGDATRDLIWGGFSVGDPTVTRFFTFHYTAAFILAAFAAMHMLALHEHGSGNPLGISSNADKLPMHPFFTLKDCVTIVGFFLVVAYLISYAPNLLGHPDNYIPANPMSTPASIVPEWYLLPFYAILRSVPNKLLGVIAMLASLLILLAMPILDLGRFRGVQHRPVTRFILVTLAVSFVILLQLGALHVEAPFVTLGQITSVFYFAWFLVLLPLAALIDNTFGEITLSQSSYSLTSQNRPGIRNFSTSAKSNQDLSTHISSIRAGELGQGHPFHLVDSSPWPLSTSVILGTVAASLILTFYGATNASFLLLISTIALIINMSLWFSDIISEGSLNGDHTMSVVKMLTNGMVLFIITEVMFFFFVFWGYLHSSLSPAVELGSLWPPVGIEPLNAAAIPTLNTILLLSSGAAVTWSHHALLSGNRSGSINGAILTIVLAVIFTFLQGYEYVTATFTMSDSVYGNIFFLGTGAHGLHVIMGTIMIAVATLRLVFYHATSQHHVGYEAAILYWHFVDVVWLVLYVIFYWWGS